MCADAASKTDTSKVVRSLNSLTRTGQKESGRAAPALLKVQPLSLKGNLSVHH